MSHLGKSSHGTETNGNDLNSEQLRHAVVDTSYFCTHIHVCSSARQQLRKISQIGAKAQPSNALGQHPGDVPENPASRDHMGSASLHHLRTSPPSSLPPGLPPDKSSNISSCIKSKKKVKQ